jgi:hypothetical protein
MADGERDDADRRAAYDRLFSVGITVSEHLVGSKRAVRVGNGPVCVSPAMYDLMKHATPEELQTLLKSIEVLRLPALPGMYESLPMTTVPS